MNREDETMTRHIWWPIDPDNGQFASALRTGTWRTINGHSERVSPLVMEWEKGPDVVPDFLLPGFSRELMTHEHIFRELQERFGGIEAGPVKIIPPKWKRKKKRAVDAADTALTIWSEHLRLVDVRIVHWVNVDWDRSCIQTVHEDGQVRHKVCGGEHTECTVNPDTFEVTIRRIPRVKGGGIFVEANRLEGHSIFKVNEFPVWNLCTDAVRDFILEKQYTGIDFFEVGELF